jgi:hypothetical protein
MVISAGYDGSGDSPGERAADIFEAEPLREFDYGDELTTPLVIPPFITMSQNLVCII